MKTREIKFRAWDKIHNEMFFPTIINLFINNRLSKYSDGSGQITLKDAILMQYTGLKDKNGKEIYEGDIARYNGKFYKVRWDRIDACFDFFISNKEDAYNGKIAEQTEIIGNIYENPELLKKGE